MADETDKKAPLVPLIVGLQGRVVALDVYTGEVVWHNELQGSGLASVALAVNDDWVFASASAARIFCLNRQTGETVWSEKTTGLGRATILLEPEEEVLFVAKSGHIDCFSMAYGEVSWSKDLSKLGKKSVALGLTGNVVQADQ